MQLEGLQQLKLHRAQQPSRRTLSIAYCPATCSRIAYQEIPLHTKHTCTRAQAPSTAARPFPFNSKNPPPQQTPHVSLTPLCHTYMRTRQVHAMYRHAHAMYREVDAAATYLGC